MSAADRDHGIRRLLTRKFKRYFCCLQERTPGVPSARTQHRIFVPLPVPAGLRRVPLCCLFAFLILAEVFSFILYICTV